jgi:hypothetical protein
MYVLCMWFGAGRRHGGRGKGFIIIIIIITTTQRIAFGIEAVRGRFIRCTGEQALR